MKKIIIGIAAMATLASPALARDYQRADNATYSMSSKMHGADAVSRMNASYAAVIDTSITQRERDRAETSQYR